MLASAGDVYVLQGACLLSFVFFWTKLGTLHCVAQCTDSVPTVCRQCADSVPTVYRQCADSVPTVCRQCADSVPTLYRQCTDSVPTVCRQCADRGYRQVEGANVGSSIIASRISTGVKCLGGVAATATECGGRPRMRLRGQSGIGHVWCIASVAFAAYNGSSAPSASTSRPSVVLFGTSCLFSGQLRRGHRGQDGKGSSIEDDAAGVAQKERRER